MYRFKQLFLLLTDLTLLYLGLYLAVALRGWSWPGQNWLTLLVPFSQLFGVAVISNFVIGLYDLVNHRNTWSFYQKILLAGGIWTAVGVVYFYGRPGLFVTPKTILLLTTVIGFGLIALWRGLYNRYLARAFWKNRVVFAGFTPEVGELIDFISAHPEVGYLVTGLVTAPAAASANLPAVAHVTSLKELSAQTNFDTIVVAPEPNANPEFLKELYQQLFRPVTIMDLDQFYAQVFRRVPPMIFSEAWFLTNLREPQKKIYDRARILADYSLALVMGLFCLVTAPLVALVIRLDSPGPILFRQTRVGRLGRPFTIYKYRTMQTLSPDGSAELYGPQFAATNDRRITLVGRFLRRTRLDELPQFINILRGEMAFIGPRPERPEFVAALTSEMPFYTLRHLIKPGLTGWAQIHKSYYGDLKENLRKLEYDLFYIKNRGLLLDLVILLRTLNIVARLAGR